MNNKFFKNFINDKEKDLKWHNVNFFYVSTIVMVVAMIIGYYVFKSQTNPIVVQNNFWNIYLMSFYHGGTVHIVFNILMLVLVSLLLERHFGSFTYFVMLTIIIPLANLTCFAVCGLKYKFGTWSGCGESCVNYFLIGFVIIVAIFNFKKYFMTKNAFVFFIPMALNIFFSSVNSNDITSPAEFFANPSMSFMYAFNNEPGHLAPFIVGIAVGLLIYTILKTTKYKERI